VFLHAISPEEVERRRGEAVLCSKLDHQNVVRYYTSWVEGGAGLGTAPPIEVPAEEPARKSPAPESMGEGGGGGVEVSQPSLPTAMWTARDRTPLPLSRTALGAAGDAAAVGGGGGGWPGDGALPWDRPGDLSGTRSTAPGRPHHRPHGAGNVVVVVQIDQSLIWK